MCEQTEINYLDGDIVWVKLGGCWWPGQVTGFHNLPEDIQREFQKKPLIAAVKFFQEDTYEYVKNYQQIYKYNCTLKDEFIRKGLDKYRSKIKDGASYMSKFPGDVEMAEKLTGGDPDILNSDKFSPEEKPDISALFGDKKVQKKKKDRDESHRRSDGTENIRKITHPRFLKESDHEVRIRQQPSSLPPTPHSLSTPQYPCHLCNFTSSRVNVIICHIKSHRSGNSSVARSRVKTYSQSRSKDSDTPKRKYVKKEKNQHKNKIESTMDSGKRKQSKQNEKANKKKKSDPELREKLLADWDDESDEEISFDQNKSFNTSTSRSSPTRDQSYMDVSEEHKEATPSEITDTHEILAETEKLLRETEKFASINIESDTLTSSVRKVECNIEEKEPLSPNLDKDELTDKFDKEKETSNLECENKHSTFDKDDKKSRLSCFDFDEDDVPEPSIPPVRKIPRVFGEKNLSLKKEIIKEFEMSQALRTEKEVGSDKISAAMEHDISKKSNKTEETMLKNNLDIQDTEKIDDSSKSSDTNDETNNKLVESEKKSEGKSDEMISQDKEKQKSSNNCETELEIVEIFEVEKEVAQDGNSANINKGSEPKTSIDKNDSDKLMADNETCVEDKMRETPPATNNVIEKIEVSQDNTIAKQMDDTLSEQFTTETEDETVSESAETLPEQSESSDVDLNEVPKSEKDILLSNLQGELTFKIKRRRGRPRKSTESVDTSVDDNEKTLKDNRSRTSESDTDRSYSGRKRKPNKRYFESDESTQEEKSIFKTDDSQSEGDERFHEKPKVKSRRGKKLMGQKNKNIDSVKQMEELELSEEMMEVTEDNVKTAKLSPKHVSPDQNDIISEISLEKKPPDDEITTSTSQKTSLECTNMDVNMEQSDATLLSESLTLLPPKDVIIEPLKEETELLQVMNQETETDLILNKTSIVEELLKNENESASKTVELQGSNNADIQKQSDVSKTTIDMLPPKKSQIKKFELSQLDIPSESTTTDHDTESQEEENKFINIENKINAKSTDLEDKNVSSESIEKVESKTSTDLNIEIEMKEAIEITTAEDKKSQQIHTDAVVSKDIAQCDERAESKKSSEQDGEDTKSEDIESMPKDIMKTSSDPQTLKKLMQTRYKGKVIPEPGVKSKKEKDAFLDEKPINTFQEAFLKTLQMDKKKDVLEDNELISNKGKKSNKKSIKRKSDELNNVNTVVLGIPDVKVGNLEENTDLSENVSSMQSQENLPNVSIMSGFHGVEVVVQENIETNKKVDEPVLQNTSQMPSSSHEYNLISQTQLPLLEDTANSTNLDFPKIEESPKVEVPAPSPTSEANIPVKKREMPRIIENVTLTEPMQILKSKLLDKLPQKGIKHKLESDTKRNDPKGSPKAKIMKIESLPSNSKMKTGLKVNSPNLSLTQKLQVLKAEENEGAAIEKANVQTTQALTATSSGSEKYIQQSSQSLADMELDINSMPFVLSEDVLTPENIEQMPVVISSIIPASSSVAPTLSLAPTTQAVTPNQMQLKSESTSEASPTKKKSGTPAILKNKYRAKPIITSIRTIVPPLTGGVKGLKFQNTPAGKATPILTQKASPGKYVVVHTAGGQQVRYSVQGKSGVQQKIAVSPGKGTGNPQVVHQGGKVVIFTSAQSGQTKMIPLNISKTLSGKRIMTNKGQLLCPISPQNIVTSKTIIAPKGDNNSPTTSKLGPKIINTPSIITSKGVLTPLSGTITKTALLGTLSQGILTKGGIYTPISASALGGRTIINSKALVTKGATILSSQNLGGPKAILTPISQTIGGKPILGTNLVTSKGTVLTPVTGQQVKAIVAKSPSKSGKMQYQSMQHKAQLSAAQKAHKVPLSSSQSRGSSSKSSSSSMVFQNTGSSSKVTSQSKKINKQMAIQQSTAMQNLSSQSNTSQTVTPQVQQKGKPVSSSSVQKVLIPRSGSRQSRNQQKIVVQKMQEANAAQNIQSKQNILSSHTTLPNISKPMTQHKHTSGNAMTPKNTAKSHMTNKSSQKNLLNIAMNSISGTNVNTNLSAPLSLPPLEPIEPETKLKMDNTIIENVQKDQSNVEKVHIEKSTEIEKIDEPKVTTQPQIMALPTESSDGTQTYVLVTIDEQGQIQPLDNNTLMSLEGTTQNPDGTRTLYIDPSSLGEATTLDNIVLQFDNGVLPNVATSTNEASQTIMSDSFPTSEIIQTSNQDILAAALANTDFQQEINLPENPTGSVMTTGLTQTSLINQTILQSTIIPPTEPISSPSVLETSLTLNQPIMTPLEVPSNLPIQSESSASIVSAIPSSLELPITITNPNISYISTGETQIQIPGNSMPDIGDIMDSTASTEIARTDIPTSTQYLVIPNLDENMTVKTQEAVSGTNVSYSVSLPCNIVLETTPVQTTPSMPIIDDTYTDNTQFSTSIQTSIAAEHNFADVPVSEMLVSKASITSPVNVQMSDVTVAPEMNVTSQEVPMSSQDSSISTNETCILKKADDATMPLEEIYPSREIPVSSQELILQPNIKKDVTHDITVTTQEKISNNENILNMQLVDQAVNSMTSSMPILDNDALIQSESNIKVQSVEHMTFEVTDSVTDMETSSQETDTESKFKQFSYKDDVNIKVASPTLVEQTATTNQTETMHEVLQGISVVQSLNNTNTENIKVEEAVDSEIYNSTVKPSGDCQADEPTSQDESDGNHVQGNIQIHFGKTQVESNQETPSQSFEQFDISMTNDPADLPSQSASKLENSGEPSQSVTYEPMETDEETIAREPPTQSFEHLKQNEASQSYETSTEVNVNAPTQSFNELMQSHDGRIVTNEAIDDQSFPTQSYEVGKVENIPDNLETDAEISQEGNIPSQSNDIGTDGIGTSSVSTNNSGLNEDETASSSYVPETPENQERDQDQESAISTSSYEIPPCEELNIASSSTIPDTSVRTEHTSIHDNGVPEIPTSSYNLNPDITSTHIDSVPTSSYEDQVIVEQNVSTSYEVPVSMPGLEETSSQNFVTESTDHRNEPSSYYTHHQEVTASYYESVDQEGNSRLEEDPQEEVTPSYYEGNPQVASQSYFTPEEATPSYSSRNVSSGYYGHRPESEASQSYYSADDLEKTEQSNSQNIEASQSFYQEHTDELRLRQQGEATPTYSERYPVDYTLDNSPIERHDLVESSVPATKPMER
ncbi:mucin-17-like isoform X1 [Vespula maculifrons]|uniref:Mucin-17-like isoform X1 n=1 Tax=Vespula maculifrons TaxID=7453 RepID=A0ABD2CFQ8_VESMC